VLPARVEHKGHVAVPDKRASGVQAGIRGMNHDASRLVSRAWRLDGASKSIDE
jgi:hypothetical protein